jgi:hypothetical protein
MQVLQYWTYVIVDQYVFDFLQWKVDEMFIHVFHVLLVLVYIKCKYMWYIYQ